MNKQILKINKNELINFLEEYCCFRICFSQKRTSHNKKICIYLGIQIDRNLSFDEQLIKNLKKMARTIGSIYLKRCLIPLNASILLLKSLVLSHLSFLAILFNLYQQKTKNAVIIRLTGV